jgi:hypothetical protein
MVQNMLILKGWEAATSLASSVQGVCDRAFNSVIGAEARQLSSRSVR